MKKVKTIIAGMLILVSTMVYSQSDYKDCRYADVMTGDEIVGECILCIFTHADYLHVMMISKDLKKFSHVIDMDNILIAEGGVIVGKDTNGGMVTITLELVPFHDKDITILPK